MFTEFQNQVWTNSATGVTVANNTDTSIDGSSKKIVWTETGSTVTITYDSVTLSNYEEVSLHIFVKDILATNLFSLTVGGETFNFSRSDFLRGRWNHILIDCSNMVSPSTSLVITSLTDNLTIFFDYAGYRKVTYDCDIDIINALKNHINLDYDVSTLLSDNASIGDTQIYFDTSGIIGYITDNSVLELDDGAGTVEIVYLLNKEGELTEALENNFSINDTVRVICPIRSEDYDDLQPDPICGIKVYDVSVDKQETVMKAKNQSKIKAYLGALGIVIYIDCSSKKKVLKMAREFNSKYGKEFQFLLDGEQVDIYMESSTFADDMIGNNPRMAYFYRLEPQPYLVANATVIDTLTLTTNSVTI